MQLRPTRLSLVLLAVLAALLLMAMNYQNNAAYLLFSVLGSIAVLSLLGARKNLQSLRLLRVVAQDASFGAQPGLWLHLEATGAGVRQLIICAESLVGSRWELQHPGFRGPATLFVPLGQAPAGVHTVAKLLLRSRHPFAVLEARTLLSIQVQVQVFPRADGQLPLPDSGEHSLETAADFHGHRSYAQGDPPQRIDWKVAARSDTLLVKYFGSERQGQTLHLGLQGLEHLGPSQALRQLSAWVQQAEQLGCSWSLELPRERLPVGLGAAHRQASLAALARAQPGAEIVEPAAPEPSRAHRGTVLVVMLIATLPHILSGGLAFLLVCPPMAWWWWKRGRTRMPSRTMRAVIALGLLVLLLVSNGLGIGLAAGMLLVFSWCRLFEVRSDTEVREHCLLALLLLTAHMLRFADLISTVYAAVSFVAILGALERVAAPEALTPPWQQAGRTAWRYALTALPLAAVVFISLPRFHIPLGITPDRAITGISDILDPAAIAELAEDTSEAFTVSFQGDPPPAAQWYWRGPVLGRVDTKHVWHSDLEPLAANKRIAPPETQGVLHEVLLPATGQRWLFTLDHPLDRVARAEMQESAWLVMHARAEVWQRRTYTASSRPGGTLPAEAPAPKFLETPELGPRTLALAKELAQAGSAADTVRSLLHYFRSRGFQYTRSPGTMSGNPTETFLFQARQGFCGHYASAAALLLRAAGVPARVVVGYRGGAWNRLGGFIEVRQKEAHAWTEAYVDGAWRRLDPTDVVPIAPGSEPAGITRDAPGEPERELGAMAAGFAEIMRWVDYADYTWMRLVLGFDSVAQRALLGILGLGGIGLWGAIGITISMIAFLLWLAGRWLARPSVRDPAADAWLRFCARCAAAGLKRAPSEGPRDFAARAAQAFPERAAAISQFLEAYLTARYHNRSWSKRSLLHLGRKAQPSWSRRIEHQLE